MVHDIELTDAEIDSGVIFLHSDVWPGAVQGEPTYWIADHPSGWQAYGWADSLGDAHDDIEKAMARDLEAAGYQIELDPTLRITRIHHP